MTWPADAWYVAAEVAECPAAAGPVVAGFAAAGFAEEAAGHANSAAESGKAAVVARRAGLPEGGVAETDAFL